MPPSSDNLPGRKQRRAAERAEKKKRRGKQPGSPGAAMTRDVPDRTEDHYPQGGCTCGRDLADAGDPGVTRSYQQEGIPASPTERVQHDLGCRRRHRRAQPVAPSLCPLRTAPAG